CEAPPAEVRLSARKKDDVTFAEHGVVNGHSVETDLRPVEDAPVTLDAGERPAHGEVEEAVGVELPDLVRVVTGKQLRNGRRWRVIAGRAEPGDQHGVTKRRARTDDGRFRDADEFHKTAPFATRL